MGDSVDNLIVGLGDTGLSVARYLALHGESFEIADSRPKPPRWAEWAQEFPRARCHIGSFDKSLFGAARRVILSPGVAYDTPAVATAVASGSDVVGDIELFARAVTAPVIGITGSNGKSTTTSLVGTVLAQQGMNARMGGNLGRPALDLLREPEPDVYVLELSSFQLETTYSLKLAVAALLNISADHLDRYRDFECYAMAKRRIFKGAQSAVINRQDVQTQTNLPAGLGATSFGVDEPLHNQVGVVKHGAKEYLAYGDEILVALEDIPLVGQHNHANLAAAAAIVITFGVSPKTLAAPFVEFKGLPHRTEFVAEWGGIRWYDDSKGTNVGAAAAALQGFTAPIVLLAGGQAKTRDFSELRTAVMRNTRAVILFGQDAECIAQALLDVVKIIRVDDMCAAVRAASEVAMPGDVVLLSPACASFDMYQDYKQRGRDYARHVQNLSS